MRLWTIGHSTRKIDYFISLLERYEHFPELGGRRKPKHNSRNTAWRNASFRGYADYMETEEFRKGADRLVDLANDAGRTAIMCAEALWWRCHRALISDYLKARGIEVMHIIDANKSDPHPYTSAARIVDGELSYRSESLPQCSESWVGRDSNPEPTP
ncbi:MAG: hypothetical protein DME77_09550 [Verrucomicrobia bacterium]|nr:MAG: hypothetical protein DME77_09550 [Verrucomicrobiota bacterium]